MPPANKTIPTGVVEKEREKEGKKQKHFSLVLLQISSKGFHISFKEGEEAEAFFLQNSVSEVFRLFFKAKAFFADFTYRFVSSFSRYFSMEWRK